MNEQDIDIWHRASITLRMVIPRWTCSHEPGNGVRISEYDLEVMLAIDSDGTGLLLGLDKASLRLFISFIARHCEIRTHHLCCVCVNFIHKWRDLQFNVDSE